jgi:uroporphyrinogen-III synthase
VTGGPRVAVTRATERAALLSHELALRGAEAIHFPLTVTVPPADPRSLALAAAGVESYDLAVFTSANAVTALLAARGAEWPRPGPVVAAVGAATARALAAEGIAVAIVPTEADAAALAREIAARFAGRLAGRRVLLPHGDLANPGLAVALRAGGADVDAVIAYRTVAAAPAAGAELAAALEGGAIDVVTFAAGSTVDAFVAQVAESRARSTLRRAAVVALRGTATRALERLGRGTDAVATERTMASLADAALTAAATRRDDPPRRSRDVRDSLDEP